MRLGPCQARKRGFGVALQGQQQRRLGWGQQPGTAGLGQIGKGGVLLKEKRPELVAELLHEVVTDTALRRAVLATQRRAAAAVRATRFEDVVLDRLSPLLGGGAVRGGSPEGTGGGA